jgi:hypothetical protein
VRKPESTLRAATQEASSEAPPLSTFAPAKVRAFVNSAATQEFGKDLIGETWELVL